MIHCNLIVLFTRNMNNDVAMLENLMSFYRNTRPLTINDQLQFYASQTSRLQRKVSETTASAVALNKNLFIQ